MQLREKVAQAYERTTDYRKQIDPKIIFALVQRIETGAVRVTSPRIDGTRRQNGFRGSSSATIADDPAVKRAHALLDTIVYSLAACEQAAHRAADAYGELAALAADGTKQAITAWQCPGWQRDGHSTDQRKVNGVCKQCADRKYAAEHRDERAERKRQRKADALAA